MNASPDPRARANRLGAVAMSAAMTLVIVNDAMIKLASETLPAAETIGIRGCFATLWVVLAVLAAGQGRDLRLVADPRTLRRAALDVAGTFSYLAALFHIPLPEATAVNMAAPLMMVVLAVLFLRETVPWRRWAAVMAGFAGVLLVVRPGGAGFTWWAALALGATALGAARDVYTTRISGRVPSLVVSLATAGAVTATALAATTVQGWQPVSAVQVMLLAGASVFLAAAYYLMILAMRLGEVSVVGAFRYSALPAAALLGWAVWGYLPDAVACLGMVVLVVAGLYLLRQKR